MLAGVNQFRTPVKSTTVQVNASDVHAILDTAPYTAYIRLLHFEDALAQ